MKFGVFQSRKTLYLYLYTRYMQNFKIYIAFPSYTVYVIGLRISLSLSLSDALSIPCTASHYFLIVWASFFSYFIHILCRLFLSALFIISIGCNQHKNWFTLTEKLIPLLWNAKQLTLTRFGSSTIEIGYDGGAINSTRN